jgi:pyridoxamine 5'-phosphate oxidase-like protein
MVSWNELEQSEPELAARVRASFDRHLHKTMATVRKDGGPRISAIEVEFRNGEVWLGSMWQARKALDLLRDPRLALHSGTADPELDAAGDAKISGRAFESDDPDEIALTAEKAPPGPFHLFRVDIDEVVVIGIGDPPDHIVVDHWSSTTGRHSTKRT